MVNFLYDQIISNEFEKRVIVCYEKQADANYVLILAAIENQNELNEYGADLYCANDQVEHRRIFEENIEALVTSVCWECTRTFAN